MRSSVPKLQRRWSEYVSRICTGNCNSGGNELKSRGVFGRTRSRSSHRTSNVALDQWCMVPASGCRARRMRMALSPRKRFSGCCCLSASIALIVPLPLPLLRTSTVISRCKICAAVLFSTVEVPCLIVSAHSPLLHQVEKLETQRDIGQ